MGKGTPFVLGDNTEGSSSSKWSSWRPPDRKRRWTPSRRGMSHAYRTHVHSILCRVPGLRPDCGCSYDRAGSQEYQRLWVVIPPAPSEFHKSHPHQQYSHEVHGTAYPAFPRDRKDWRYPLEEPLSHTPAHPGSGLRWLRGIEGPGLCRSRDRWSVSSAKHLLPEPEGEHKKKKRIPCSALVHKGWRFTGRRSQG